MSFLLVSLFGVRNEQPQEPFFLQGTCKIVDDDMEQTF